MSVNECMYSSESTMWETPQSFFDILNKRFRFQIDVCAIPENAKCEKFFSPEQDGLKQEWSERNWMNPPYGIEIKRWVEKAYKF